MDDFISDNTLSTKYAFILPERTNAPWYKTFMCCFEVVKRIPKNTSNVFNQPLTGDMEPVPGEEHRSYAGPTPWPVIVIYKDQFTKSNVTDVMLLHLQLGQALREDPCSDDIFLLIILNSSTHIHLQFIFIYFIIYTFYLIIYVSIKIHFV